MKFLTAAELSELRAEGKFPFSAGLVKCIGIAAALVSLFFSIPKDLSILFSGIEGCISVGTKVIGIPLAVYLLTIFVLSMIQTRFSLGANPEKGIEPFRVVRALCTEFLMLGVLLMLVYFFIPEVLILTRTGEFSGIPQLARYLLSVLVVVLLGKAFFSFILTHLLFHYRHQKKESLLKE